MSEDPTITHRTERDSMGEKQIPSNVYYGIQTLRAVENFPISGIKPLSTYVDACILIKKATAIATIHPIVGFQFDRFNDLCCIVLKGQMLCLSITIVA
jgi:hypothetical protein